MPENHLAPIDLAGHEEFEEGTEGRPQTPTGKIELDPHELRQAREAFLKRLNTLSYDEQVILSPDL